MRIKNSIGAVVIVLLSLSFIYLTVRNEEKLLFPKDEIHYSNIAHLEVLDVELNESMVVDDKRDIQKISAILEEMNTEDVSDFIPQSKLPIYSIYITNEGRNGNPPISIMDNSVSYRGNMKYLSSEEAKLVIQQIEAVLN